MRNLCNSGMLHDRMTEPTFSAVADVSQRFVPTQKLHAFVAMLCATPFPQQVWADPRTNERLQGPGVDRPQDSADQKMQGFM